MIFVVILLIPTAIFLIRSLAALGGFLKWHKKELLVGTVGELEELRASGKSRKYAYVFTIERGSEVIETRIYCMRLSAGESRFRPGEALPVWYEPLPRQKRPRPRSLAEPAALRRLRRRRFRSLLPHTEDISDTAVRTKRLFPSRKQAFFCGANLGNYMPIPDVKKERFDR